jgi:hypothetical protein
VRPPPTASGEGLHPTSKVFGAAQPRRGESHDVPVGRIGHLLALKVLSESERRLQDRIDIQVLAKVATDEGSRTAEAMVRGPPGRA